MHVRDVDATVRFLRAAFPEFRVRGESEPDAPERWVHVGTDATYVAVYQATRTRSGDWRPYSGAPGINHLGYEVDDVEAVRARLTAAGFRETTVANRHPFRTRVYFEDADGNDWEFVQYHSDVAAERHDYELTDGA